MFVGASKNIGDGVRVGAGASAEEVGKGLLLAIIFLPGVLWLVTGLSILKGFAVAAATGTPQVDVDDVELNVLCFFVTLAELAIYFIGIPALLG